MTVQLRNGMLSTDADLDQLVARSTGGHVTLGGSVRRVEVHLRHGDITTGNPIAVTESFTADVDPGDIAVALEVPHNLGDLQ